MRTPRWLTAIYFLILILGIIIALPNLLTEQQYQKYLGFLPDNRVTLGLDLQGGSYLVLEVDKNYVKRDQLKTLLDTVRSELRKEQIQTNSVRLQGDGLSVTLKNANQKAEALSVLQKLVTPVSSGFNTTNSSDVTINSSQDNNIINIALTEAGINDRVNGAITQSLAIIDRRLNQFGVKEPSIQKVGNDRIMVQLPGLQDPKQLRNLLGSTAKMTFHFVATGVDFNNPPIGVSVLDGYIDTQERFAVSDQVVLDGSVVDNAQANFDPQTGAPIISFTMNSIGATAFQDITQNNIGKTLAIVLDNKVLTAPVIRSVIPNGTGQISGDYTYPVASTVAALIRAGSLPAPLTVIEERTVGPDLGADAIKMGLYTGVAGFALVAVFIFLLYGLWGIIADIALALHTILTFAVLGLIDATLTLPGIAGIILGIGIAVDANILINERIREESRKGVGVLAALDRGFKQAFSTIIDANVTAVIATLLLLWFGTGPVRGFAVTMLLGIIISMFTDITIVRIIMVWVVRRWNIKKLNIQPFLNFIPQHTNFRFMNARFLGIGISIALSIASLFLFFKPGLNFGIDFMGGSQVTITTKMPADMANLRSTLNNLGLGEIALQNVDNENTVMIRIQQQEGAELEQTAAVEKVKTAITGMYSDVSFEQTETVGPKVSGELARAGFTAVILAAIAMGIYIWWRFEWFFAVGAILTLVLDTTKMVGFFALFQLDFNLTAIAALLTIVGYSVNDKVVVYDRMRENMRLYKKMSLRELIDMSINQVLVRCVFTSTTTVLAMLPMAIWGGSAVHNFAVPMVVGIIIATSSSIYIAAPILLFLGDWWHNHNKGRETSKTAVSS